MSEAALRARRRNLSRTRLRSAIESQIIKRLIWQSLFEPAPRQSQRALARQLGVWRSYVDKVQKQAADGLDALASGRRVTFEDLAKARELSDRIKLEEPSSFSSAPPHLSLDQIRVRTTDESIAERWREVREERRKNPITRRRVLFSVPVR